MYVRTFSNGRLQFEPESSFTVATLDVETMEAFEKYLAGMAREYDFMFWSHRSTTKPV